MKEPCLSPFLRVRNGTAVLRARINAHKRGPGPWLLVQAESPERPRPWLCGGCSDAWGTTLMSSQSRCEPWASSHTKTSLQMVYAKDGSTWERGNGPVPGVGAGSSACVGRIGLGLVERRQCEGVRLRWTLEAAVKTLFWE